jgi:phosphopantothenoylcysteine decarboxylase
MSRVLLGVTGSVAAIKTPELVDALANAGHDVRLVITEAAKYFFDWQSLGEQVITDADEWPGDRYTRGDTVRHIELRNWADHFVIAPLDANTLAKLAAGLCDNALTCVARAWDTRRPMLLAPAMNTLMWEHPATRRNLAQIAADAGISTVDSPTVESMIAIINHANERLIVVPPISKSLACGDVGLGAMAEIAVIVESIAAAAADLASMPSHHHDRGS